MSMPIRPNQVSLHNRPDCALHPSKTRSDAAHPCTKIFKIMHFLSYRQRLPRSRFDTGQKVHDFEKRTQSSPRMQQKSGRRKPGSRLQSIACNL